MPPALAAAQFAVIDGHRLSHHFGWIASRSGYSSGEMEASLRGREIREGAGGDCTLTIKLRPVVYYGRSISSMGDVLEFLVRYLSYPRICRKIAQTLESQGLNLTKIGENPGSWGRGERFLKGD
ncbi:MAG: hypothetical protein ACI9TH_004704 [Kiritimatiellia bacterium]|jgi:hypothetical protein